MAILKALFFIPPLLALETLLAVIAPRTLEADEAEDTDGTFLALALSQLDHELEAEGWWGTSWK